MRAIWITKAGGPEALELRETADPEPGRGQVRIRVHVAGLNFADVMAAQGLYPDAPKLPCVVGYEAAGVVEALGPETEGRAVGERVLALTHFGGHADVVCVPAEQVFGIPDGMSFEEAAAIPVNYITAHHMLFRIANVRPGERVLVHMAAGGVGMAVLQLCRAVDGLVVFGTASAAKHGALRAEGCTHPIDYHTADYAAEIRRLTGGHGVDVILDPLRRQRLEEGAEATAPVRPAESRSGSPTWPAGSGAARPMWPPRPPGHPAADTTAADEPQPDGQRRQHRPPVGEDRCPPRGTPGGSRPLGRGEHQAAHRRGLPLH